MRNVERGSLEKAKSPPASPRFLLIGPYDPMGGEYTFLAPPLGVWRLAGVLADAGLRAQVFDPNCSETAPEAALAHIDGAISLYDLDTNRPIADKPDWNRIKTTDLQGVYLSVVLSVRFTVHPYDPWLTRLKANKIL